MSLRTPLIAINFKVYATSTGKQAVSLAKACAAVAKKEKVSMIVCVQAADVAAVSSAVSLPVFAQHVDPIDFGAFTGKIHARAIKDNGGSGTLLNHSEDQYSFEKLTAAIAACKLHGLVTIVCASSPDMAKRIVELKPDVIAYEPPELVGGNVSVTTKPELISAVLSAIKPNHPNVRVIVGAGVKTAQDVAIALSLGADGVLLASGVTKADDPKKVLDDLARGLNSHNIHN